MDTKYRYHVLTGDVGNRCRELLREISRIKEMQIHAGSINRDHMLISIPPSLSVSKAGISDLVKNKITYGLFI